MYIVMRSIQHLFEIYLMFFKRNCLKTGEITFLATRVIVLDKSSTVNVKDPTVTTSIFYTSVRTEPFGTLSV
jgi:hypothetical protein